MDGTTKALLYPPAGHGDPPAGHGDNNDFTGKRWSCDNDTGVNLQILNVKSATPTDLDKDVYVYYT